MGSYLGNDDDLYNQYFQGQGAGSGNWSPDTFSAATDAGGAGGAAAGGGAAAAGAAGGPAGIAASVGGSFLTNYMANKAKEFENRRALQMKNNSDYADNQDKAFSTLAQGWGKALT